MHIFFTAHPDLLHSFSRQCIGPTNSNYLPLSLEKTEKEAKYLAPHAEASLLKEANRRMDAELHA